MQPIPNHRFSLLCRALLKLLPLVVCVLGLRVWHEGSGLWEEISVLNGFTMQPLAVGPNSVTSYQNEKRILGALAYNWSSAETTRSDSRPSARLRWSGTIEIPEPPPPPIGHATKGLSRRIYRNIFDGSPAIEDVTFSMTVTDSELRQIGSPKKFSVEWTGSIITESSEEIRFLNNSAGNFCSFAVNGERLLTHAESDAAAATETIATIRLTKGLHAISGVCVGGAAMTKPALMWTRTSGDFSQIPAKNLRTRNPLLEGTRLWIRSVAPGSVRLDGAPLLSTSGGKHSVDLSASISPGLHTIEADFDLPTSAKDWFVTLGIGALGRYSSTIPSRMLRTGRIDWSTVTGNAFLLSTIVILASAVLCWNVPEEQLFSKELWAFGAIAVCTLAFRLFDSERMPPFLEVYDEIGNAWIGWNLLHEGVPKGWTIPGSYRDLQSDWWLGTLFNTTKTQIHPPPLFPLSLGLLSTLLGATDMLHQPFHILRPLMSLVSASVVIPLYMLMRQTTTFLTAIVACLFYATWPVAVVSGRLLKEDNILALLLVTGLWLVFKGGKSSVKYIIPLISFLGPLTKESGVFIALSLAAVYWTNNERREAFRVAVAGALGLAAYGVYVMMFAGRSYFQALGYQIDSTSDITFPRIILAGLPTYPLNQETLWILWSTITLTSFQDRLRNALVLSILSYLLAFSLVRPYSFAFVWYLAPLLPLFAAAAGRAFVEIKEGNCSFTNALFPFLVLLPLLNSVVSAHNYSFGGIQARTLLVAAASLAALWSVPLPQLPRGFHARSMVVVLIVSLVLNYMCLDGLVGRSR